MERDLTMLEAEGADVVFAPSVEEIYPPGYDTAVEVDRLSRRQEGAVRPGHFRGVATVVAKLLNIVTPDCLYLGAKDAQQIVVLKKMVADLNFPTTIIECPTVRETDGLALSSRNQYLTQQQRSEAPVLYRSLKQAKQLVHSETVLEL